MEEVKIPLHPKHGLNATIPQCFFCRKAKGGIAPLGNKIKGKAPPLSVLDYEPCNECKANMLRGISVIEMDSAEKLNQPEMLAGLAPTGRWFICSEQRLKEIAVILHLRDDHVIPILANQRMLMEPSLYEQFRPHEEPKQEVIPPKKRTRRK